MPMMTMMAGSWGLGTGDDDGWDQYVHVQMSVLSAFVNLDADHILHLLLLHVLPLLLHDLLRALRLLWQLVRASVMPRMMTAP